MNVESCSRFRPTYIYINLTFQKYDHDWEMDIDLDSDCNASNKDKLKLVVTLLLVDNMSTPAQSVSQNVSETFKVLDKL